MFMSYSNVNENKYKNRKINTKLKLNYILKVIIINLYFLGIDDIQALDFEQSSISQDNSNIAIFVSIDPSSPNSATVNLYHDVITNIRKYYSNRWNVVKTSDVIKYIDSYNNEDSNILRSVLYVDRQDFLSSKEGKEPIKILQYILETFAIEDSIVVDCVSNGDSFVQSCGLYVYSRIKKRFTVAVEKIFTSPISDTSSWGKILVDRLVYNIRSMEEESTQLKLNKLLEESNENEGIDSRIEVGFKISSVKSFVKRIYGISLGLIFNDMKENKNIDEESRNIGSRNNGSKIYYGFRIGYDLGKKGSNSKDTYLSVKSIMVPVGLKYVYRSQYIFSLEVALGYSEQICWNIYNNDSNSNVVSKSNVGIKTLRLNSKDEKIRYKKRSLTITPRLGVGYSWEYFRLDGFMEYGKFIHLSKNIKKRSKDINYYIGGGVTVSFYL